MKNFLNNQPNCLYESDNIRFDDQICHEVQLPRSLSENLGWFTFPASLNIKWNTLYETRTQRKWIKQCACHCFEDDRPTFLSEPGPFETVMIRNDQFERPKRKSIPKSPSLEKPAKPPGYSSVMVGKKRVRGTARKISNEDKKEVKTKGVVVSWVDQNQETKRAVNDPEEFNSVSDLEDIKKELLVEKCNRKASEELGQASRISWNSNTPEGMILHPSETSKSEDTDLTSCTTCDPAKIPSKQLQEASDANVEKPLTRNSKRFHDPKNSRSIDQRRQPPTSAETVMDSYYVHVKPRKIQSRKNFKPLEVSWVKTRRKIPHPDWFKQFYTLDPSPAINPPKITPVYLAERNRRSDFFPYQDLNENKVETGGKKQSFERIIPVYMQNVTRETEMAKWEIERKERQQRRDWCNPCAQLKTRDPCAERIACWKQKVANIALENEASKYIKPTSRNPLSEASPDSSTPYPGYGNPYQPYLGGFYPEYSGLNDAFADFDPAYGLDEQILARQETEIKQMQKARLENSMKAFFLDAECYNVCKCNEGCRCLCSKYSFMEYPNDIGSGPRVCHKTTYGHGKAAEYGQLEQNCPLQAQQYVSVEASSCGLENNVMQSGDCTTQPYPYTNVMKPIQSGRYPQSLNMAPYPFPYREVDQSNVTVMMLPGFPGTPYKAGTVGTTGTQFHTERRAGRLKDQSTGRIEHSHDYGRDSIRYSKSKYRGRSRGRHDSDDSFDDKRYSRRKREYGFGFRDYNDDSSEDYLRKHRRRRDDGDSDDSSSDYYNNRGRRKRNPDSKKVSTDSSYMDRKNHRTRSGSGVSSPRSKRHKSSESDSSSNDKKRSKKQYRKNIDLDSSTSTSITSSDSANTKLRKQQELFLNQFCCPQTKYKKSKTPKPMTLKRELKILQTKLHKLRKDACDCSTEKKKRIWFKCCRKKKKPSCCGQGPDRYEQLGAVKGPNSTCRHPVLCSKSRVGPEMEREARIRAQLKMLRETVEKIDKSDCAKTNVSLANQRRRPGGSDSKSRISKIPVLKSLKRPQPICTPNEVETLVNTSEFYSTILKPVSEIETEDYLESYSFIERNQDTDDDDGEYSDCPSTSESSHADLEQLTPKSTARVDGKKRIKLQIKLKK